MTDRDQLEAAIAAQEQLRGTISDDLIDATIGALRLQLTQTGPPPRKQRRQVTVLFADLSGFTSMSESMDAEDVSDTLDALWARLDAAITEWNGRIDKHMGDSVMGLWGVGTAREDDPEQAIKAAIAMQEAIAEMADDDGNRRLALRIGINTGPVVLGEVGSTGEFTATGDAVNVASRLEQAAPVGGILIGHDTYRHVKGIFSVEAQELLTVKGKRDPLRTYRVKGVRPRAFRLATRGVEGVETRMVGRDGELRSVQEALVRALEGRHLEFVHVVGDAGVGKSRLLYEFEDWLRVQPLEVRLFKGRATQQQQGIPYAVFRDMLFFRFLIADHEADDVALELLEQGMAELTGAQTPKDAHLLGHLIGLDIGDSNLVDRSDPRRLRDDAYAAAAQFFAAASSLMPPVVLVEDVHWADRGSLDLLEHVASECQAIPMALVALARPSLADRVPGWCSGLVLRTDIDLQALSEEDTDALVHEVLKKALSIPDALACRITTSAAGNPFYVEELIKMLIEDDVISTAEDEWTIRDDLESTLHVPATLTGVLQARLDRLTEAELSTLQRAAVVGRIFWDGAIPGSRAARGPGDNAAIAATLESLERRELVRRRDNPDFTGTTEYIFKHAILHDVTYESLLKRDRRAYHEEVGRWLSARAESAAHPVMIAQHFASAEMVAEAAHWHGKAALIAKARYANAEATEYFRLALEQRLLDPAEAVPLHDGLHEVLMLQGLYTEALGNAEAMLVVADDSGDMRDRARALMAASGAHRRLGRPEEALGAGHAAEALLRSATPVIEDELSDVLVLLGWDELLLGRFEAALLKGEEALTLASAGNERRGIRHVHTLLGAANWSLGHFDEAARHMHESLILNRQLGDRIGESRALINLGEIARLQGDFASALNLYNEALLTQRELGDIDQVGLTLSNLGGAYVGMGRYEEAVEHLTEAVNSFKATGGSEHVSETHRFLAEAHLGRGDVTAASLHASMALAAAQATTNPEQLGGAWRALGLIGATTKEPVELDGFASGPTASESFERSVRIFQEAGMDAERAQSLAAWAAYEKAAGNAEDGAVFESEADAIFRKLNLNRFVSSR